MGKQEIALNNMVNPIEIKPYKHKTKYYETDQMGVIHHSNYVKWMEEARMDLLEQIGLGYKQLESLEIICPVLSIGIDYISMAQFEETILIETKIISYDGFHMELEYKMYNNQTGDLHATAVSKHCFLNRAGKRISLKRTYPELDTKFFEMKDM